ncbi:hypothetical protein JTB14_036058 [Gonioctena quinquepunctata]|nr:hypothetical protein JTB14_036058 [Gonioctena quinquepunctata]
MPLLKFKTELAQVLTTMGTPTTNEETRKRERPSNTPQDTEHIKRRCKVASPAFESRKDGTGHWPQHSKQPNRCRLEGCNGKSRMFSGKCRVF